MVTLALVLDLSLERRDNQVWWSPDRVRALFGDRDEIPLLEFLRLPALPDIEKQWFACHYLANHHRDLLLLWITPIVDDLVRDAALHCERQIVRTWAAGWLLGRDRGWRCCQSLRRC